LTKQLFRQVLEYQIFETQVQMSQVDIDIDIDDRRFFDQGIKAKSLEERLQKAREQTKKNVPEWTDEQVEKFLDDNYIDGWYRPCEKGDWRESW
jgi:hypothetical protein